MFNNPEASNKNSVYYYSSHVSLAHRCRISSPPTKDQMTPCKQTAHHTRNIYDHKQTQKGSNYSTGDGIWSQIAFFFKNRLY